MTKRAEAPAKINLALVVGPRREDGKHELVTVYQRVALADRIELRTAADVRVTGFPEDTLVARALSELAAAGGPTLSAQIDKRIPVAAGLGGGSTDAATALMLGNRFGANALGADRLEEIARRLGADVPFFLRDGPQLGAGDGSALTALDLPQDYCVLILLPEGVVKWSTADVYSRFDEQDGGRGFETRRERLLTALKGIRSASDLAHLPANDLASSPLGEELRELGAFRADVIGAGPAVYALFHDRSVAETAGQRLRDRGRVWITGPAWYV